MTTQPEAWLRGPLPGMPALLQPAAHALTQSMEEVRTILADFPDSLLWERPAGLASVGFHLQHLAGVTDRMATYAQGRPLNETQLKELAAEKEDPGDGKEVLIERWETRAHSLLEQMRQTGEQQLTEPRTVGRKQLPSTVIGLLFHAAEHSQRHTGQLLVTARVLLNQNSP